MVLTVCTAYRAPSEGQGAAAADPAGQLAGGARAPRHQGRRLPGRHHPARAAPRRTATAAAAHSPAAAVHSEQPQVRRQD